MFFKLFKKINSVLFGKNLGRVPGVRAFHAFLYNFLRPKNEVAFDVNGFKMFLNPQDMGEVKDILLRGVYDELESDAIKKKLRAGDTALDIGAHIGYFTLLMARFVGEKGKVHAFEPEPKNFALLSRNVEANKFQNIILNSVALSSVSGKSKLFLDKDNLGNMSFSELNIPNSSRSGALEVETKTLDEYAKKIGERIGFIKIDVQGAEGLVFSGGWETLKKDKPTILMEFWPYGLKNNGTDPFEFLSELSALGYCFSVLNVKEKSLKLKLPEELMNVARNRPEGKGWANILCQT